MKRIEANDPVAMSTMGHVRYSERDYSCALEYLTRPQEWEILGRIMNFNFIIRAKVEKDEGWRWVWCVAPQNLSRSASNGERYVIYSII